MTDTTTKLPADLEKIIHDSIHQFGDILRKACQASLTYGAETSKEAIMARINELVGAHKEHIAAQAGLEKAKAAARADGVIPPGEYGAVAQAIKLALNYFRAADAGVTVLELLTYIHRHGATDVTEQQIRNTLKGLIKSGNATNPSRGRYGAGPNLPYEGGRMISVRAL
jgi:hypothetical protein